MTPTPFLRCLVGTIYISVCLLYFLHFCCCTAPTEDMLEKKNKTKAQSLRTKGKTHQLLLVSGVSKVKMASNSDEDSVFRVLIEELCFADFVAII